jgi:DNA transformation protein
MSSKEFHDYVMQDIFVDIEGITSRKMFSGYGIYLHGIIFGLIIDDELYFKVGENNINDYKRLNSHPFTYLNTKGKEIVMPYWIVPSEILEDNDALRELILNSVKASKQSKKQTA